LDLSRARNFGKNSTTFYGSPAMNILYTITFLHFGAGRALLDLAKEAKSRGHQVTIAATARIDQYESQANLVAEAENAGITVQLVEDLFTRDFTRVSASAERIVELFQNQQYHLIHSHAAVPGFAAMLASKKIYQRMLPHILTVHAWGPDKADWMKLQDVLCLNSTDIVQAVSFDVADFLIAEGVSKEKIAVIYNGCDFTRIDNLVTANNPSLLPKDKPLRIGTIADLSERKGIIYLLEAVSLLPADLLAQIEVVIVGDGPQKEQLLQKTRNLKLDHVINFVGYVSNPYSYLKSFDLFILPSLSEGLPVCLVEAMYLKVPVIATDVQGSREILNKSLNGCLIQPRNSKGLAEAIRKFYGKRVEFNNKTGPAFLWVKENFDRQMSFDKIFSLYEQLIQNQGGEQHGAKY
jgi:glycosyltransferase involved in cell wall biosynthesis